MKYLVLFDIDGTILKFKHSLAQNIFSQELEKFINKKIPEEAIPDFHGMTDLQIIKSICLNLGYPYNLIENKLNDIWNSLYVIFSEITNRDNIFLIPGVKELIINLFDDKDFLLGLVTGNFKKNAFLKIESVGLNEFFKFGAFGCDSENRDNLPPIALNRANEYIGVKDFFNNNNSIIIGDTFRDIQCAKANNIACISVSTGYQPYDELKKLDPDAIFENLTNTLLVKDTIKNILDEKNYNSN